MTEARRARARREARAEKDAEWFYGVLGGRVDHAPPEMREAAADIDAALRSILTFHRGALSLWFTKKDWPAALEKGLSSATSLVVRLACASTPSVGPTAALEAAAVERLLERIARGSPDDEDTIARFDFRAMRHFRLAIRALARAQESLPKAAPVSGVVLTGTAAESA